MNGLLKVICLIAVISLCPGVFSPGPAQAAMPTVTYLETIGADRQLLAAGAIDLDDNGNLYVADGYLGVVKYNALGTWVATFGAQPVGGSGIAVTPAGTRIYVAGSSAGSADPNQRDQVAILDGTTGALLGYLGQGAGEFVNAGEIDLDGNGRIYVLDSGTVSVKAYLDTGVGNAGADGSFSVSDNSGLDGMSGLTVDVANAVVYVSDRQAPAQIRVYSTTGGLVSSYACATQMGAALSSPAGIALDAQGRAYFLDKVNSKINVANSDGSFPAGNTITSTNIVMPNDVIVDSYGRLFVSNGSNVAVFGLDQYSLPSNSAPPAPAIISPQAGTVVGSATPQLSFGSVVDPDGDSVTYSISIACDDGTAEQAAGLTGTSYQVQSTVGDNASCQWDVSASDGTASSVAASASFSVNSVDQAPSAPANLLPGASANVNGLTVLQWDASTDPDPNDVVSYSIQFVEVGGVSLGAAAAAQSGVRLNQLDAYADMVPGQDYSWQVVASDGGLTTGSVAQVFTFTETGLIVDSSISGADVYLGGNPGYFGEKVGQTPYSVLGLPGGDYQVAVAHKGFEPVFGVVTVSSGGAAQFVANMVPAIQPVDHFIYKSGVKSRVFNASGKLVNSRDIKIGRGKSMPFLADIDDDGSLDLIVGKGGQINVLLFRGLQVNGQGRLRFGEREDFLSLPQDAITPVLADWNNDGLTDLIYGSSDGKVRLIENTGVAGVPNFDNASIIELQAGTAPISAGQFSAPIVVDWDLDGKKDLVVGGNNGNVDLYVNVGSDASPALQFNKTLVAGQAQKMRPVVVDWDADGDLDLLVSMSGSVQVFISNAGTLTDNGPLQVLAENKQDSAFLQAGGGFAVLDADNRKGKDLLMADVAGKMSFLKSRGMDILPTFYDVLVQKLDTIADMITNDSNDAVLLAMVDDAKTSANAAGLDALTGKVANLKVAQGLPAGAVAVCDELLTVLP